MNPPLFFSKSSSGISFDNQFGEWACWARTLQAVGGFTVCNVRCRFTLEYRRVAGSSVGSGEDNDAGVFVTALDGSTGSKMALNSGYPAGSFAPASSKVGCKPSTKKTIS